MKRIAIDMDDVLAKTTHVIIDRINQLVDKNYTYQELLFGDKTLKEEFYGHYLTNNSFLWEPGFFENIPVNEDAVEVVRKLSDQYEIFIVSAATEFPNSLKEKLTWMEQHFPFITWKHIVFCGHKHMIQADYLIDDHEKNLHTFTGTPLLFTAPHNLHINDFKRVNNWKEVEGLLLQ
ncbi:5' nucleotidase, NT5C type [Aquirufa sp. HETE-40SA]|jgi:5'-nucleotidase